MFTTTSDATTTATTTTTTTRKRKQQDDHRILSTSMPSNTASSWSDFIYSSPSSPSVENTNSIHQVQQQQQQQQAQNHENTTTTTNNNHFNFDSFFEQHQLSIDHNNHSGTNSRRHSVAVGEMDYHSFDFVKQDMNILPSNGDHHSNAWDDLQLLLNSTAANHNFNLHNNNHHIAYPDRPLHRRTMSLREDDPHFATLLSPAMSSVSSASSNFFSSSFLDALVAENDSNKVDNSDAATMISDMSFMDSAATTTTNGGNAELTAADFLKLASPTGEFGAGLSGTTTTGNNSTITPSAITNEINTMADWLLEQQEVKEMHTQAQKRQRRSVNSLSPVSPTHTMGSSLSSLSPSPPITPMQPASLGFEPIPFSNNNNAQAQQQTQQQGHQDEWDVNISNLLTQQQQQAHAQQSKNKVQARILQGENTATSLKPFIQAYLVRKEHSSQSDRSVPVPGERTVMVLTSRVAQKSYGTEKRFLCPPPTTILKGANWWTSIDNNNNNEGKTIFFNSQQQQQQQTNNSSTSPKLTIHISGESINQTGVIEWQTSSGTIVDSSMSTSTTAAASSNMTGRCVSKQLYINDADEKRKRVEVLAKLQLGNGLQLGTFPSKGIKVISKPSKKRQSIKNMELCIHHGTTISLFNRIRSQTVSTKYLGVSSNGQQATPSSPSKDNNNSGAPAGGGTCFVARTGSWDPFVIWIVDTTRSPDTTSMPRPNQHHPNNPNFPPPPAIALQSPSSSASPVAIHYNQPVVLQCVTTGLVSPVMVIRKVDKGSMVLGGNRMEDLSGKTGGECGDETLGDPVSQLHKIAFQIVQDPTFSSSHKARYNTSPVGVQKNGATYKIPQSCHPVTYLACLNDVVGMHKTTYSRHLIPSCQPPKVDAAVQPAATAVAGQWTDLLQGSALDTKLFDTTNATGEDVKPVSGTTKARRRMSSISSNGDSVGKGRRGSMAPGDRRGSSISDSTGLEGACWTEDVSDAAVWTIVGTDCASYTFWTPSGTHGEVGLNMPFASFPNAIASSTPITPFPVVNETNCKANNSTTLTISGENLIRDLSVWFGDVKAPVTEYKSRDVMTCTVPDLQELISSPTTCLVDEHDNASSIKKKIPLLLVRGDGVVYRTDQFYTF